MSDKDIDAIREQGLILAPASLSSDERETWVKGYVHGRILGEAVGAGRHLVEVVKELLERGLSINEISEIIGGFEEHIESIKREESMRRES